MKKGRLFLLSTIIGMLLSCMAVISSGSAQAAMPTGEYVYQFTLDAQAELWDMSGTYNEYMGDMGMNMSYTISQDDKGKFQGYGSASASIYGVDLEMEFDIVGSVKKSGDTIYVKMKMIFTGAIYYYGETIPFRGMANAAMEVNQNLGMVLGTIKMRLSARGYGSESFTSSFDMAIPDNMDGTFEIRLHINADGPKKIGGSGGLTLSNGRTYPLTIKGVYNAKKSSCKALVTGANRTGKLTLVLDGEADIVQMKGKFIGQKVVN